VARGTTTSTEGLTVEAGHDAADCLRSGAEGTDGGSGLPARARAARTKRTRTRAALLAAADSAFSARSWQAVRMEDLAAAAGVSVATAYNHFSSKHSLIGEVFAPHAAVLLQQAEEDVAAGRPVVDALSDQVDALARLSHHHRGLTAAFTAAVLEYTIRTGRTPDPDDDQDPRTLAPLPAALTRLVAHGQDTGVLLPDPPAGEVAAATVNLLLVRSLNHPDEPPADTARLLRTVLLRTTGAV
jgi:AcrR family transcriptional regulator